MAIEAGAPTDRGTGARLRAAREKKGLTVLQAAEKLHVDARVLEALEAEDFAALGADVYVRGHLRRYAELVGESPSELQELYSGGVQAARPDLTRIPRAAPAAHSSALTLPALLAVVGVAIAGIVWWALHLPGQRAREVVPAAAAPATATPAEAPAAAPAGGALPTTSLRRAPPPAVSAAAQLQLNFTAASWVDISDASGRRLLHGLIAPRHDALAKWCGATARRPGQFPRRGTALQWSAGERRWADAPRRQCAPPDRCRRPRHGRAGAPGARGLTWQARSRRCGA